MSLALKLSNELTVALNKVYADLMHLNNLQAKGAKPNGEMGAKSAKGAKGDKGDKEPMEPYR